MRYPLLAAVLLAALAATASRGGPVMVDALPAVPTLAGPIASALSRAYPGMDAGYLTDRYFESGTVGEQAACMRVAWPWRAGGGI